jgi:hypothetical protein
MHGFVMQYQQAVYTVSCAAPGRSVINSPTPSPSILPLCTAGLFAGTHSSPEACCQKAQRTEDKYPSQKTAAFMAMKKKTRLYAEILESEKVSKELGTTGSSKKQEGKNIKSQITHEHVIQANMGKRTAILAREATELKKNNESCKPCRQGEMKKIQRI